MKSLLMSVGKYCLIHILVLFLVSCASRKVKYYPTEDGSVSLKEDRQSIEEMRKNIPPEIRQRNDSLKEILSLMGELKRNPQKVRQRFDKLQRKRRNKFQKSIRKERDVFNKNERRNRKIFMEKFKVERKKFSNEKKTKNEKKYFYRDLDLRRKDYFSNQRDKRNEFESDMREKSKDFYSELREQRKEFSEEWRLYNRRWQEWQRGKRKRRDNTSGRQRPSYFNREDQQDFQRMNQIPGQTLGTDDN